MEHSPYNWYNSKPATDKVSTVDKTPVDARVKGYQFTLCEFAGNHLAPDGKRYCKHFIMNTNINRCRFFRPEFKENRKPKTYAEKSVELSACDFKEREVQSEEKTVSTDTHVGRFSEMLDAN